MLGAIIMVVVLIVVIPVGTLLSGAVAAGLLGTALKVDGEDRNEGSELIALNK